MISKIAIVLAASVLALPACGEESEPAAAVVRGRTITLDEVQRALEEFEQSPQFDQLAQQGEAATLRRTYEQNFLAQKIRRAVLRPEAEERGIEVTDAEAEERIEQIKGEFPSEEEFEKALEQQGYDMETLRDLVGDSIVEEELRAVVVEGVGPTEEEIRARYEEDAARFTQYRASHILVTQNQRAVLIAERLRAVRPGKRQQTLFAQLARRYSKDPGSAENGGDLGWAAADAYVEPFAEALRELEPGEISNPVRSDFGFHVIYLDDVRIQPFEEVSEQLRTEMAGTGEDEVWADFLAAAYEQAGVELNPRYGTIDPVTGQISDADPSSRPGAATPPSTPTPTGVPEPAE